MPRLKKYGHQGRLALTKQRDQANYIGWPALAASFQRDLDKLEAAPPAVKSDPVTRILK